MEIARYNVLGVGVSALNMELTVQWILRDAPAKRRGYVCVTGVHGIIESQDDPQLRDIHNQSALTTPDGMPLVWLGPRGTSRVYGPDLMLAVCQAGLKQGLTHYFYGGDEGVAESLRERLINRFPGLNVVGIFTPPFRALNDLETRNLQADIAACKPDVLWVGLSTPKQERFMAANWNSLNAGILIGVGAAFDFHAGRVRQAPSWIRHGGLEWLYRLWQEPRRLALRYLKNNPRFILLIMLQKSGLKKYHLTPACTKKL